MTRICKASQKTAMLRIESQLHRFYSIAAVFYSIVTLFYSMLYRFYSIATLFVALLFFAMLYIFLSSALSSLCFISAYFLYCVALCTDCNSNCASWEGKIFSLRGFKRRIIITESMQKNLSLPKAYQTWEPGRSLLRSS